MSSALVRQTASCLAAGIDFLLRSQDRDGFWRDYDLRVGPSDAWTTAWIGWCMTAFAAHPRVRSALRQATPAVLQVCTPEGWGYNRKTGADADSTAWAINFFAACGYRCRELATRLLTPFVSSTGAVRTFLDPSMGTYCDPHPDVAAMVGLALLNSRCGAKLVSSVRRKLVETAGVDGTWPSFWWATRTYATVWAALYLLRSGGMAPRHVRDLTAFLDGPSRGDTVIERGLALLLLTELKADDIVMARLAADLLDDQAASGAWSASALLLLPPRDSGYQPRDVGPHPDVKALVSTAVACVGLTHWMASLRVGRLRAT